MLVKPEIVPLRIVTLTPGVKGTILGQKSPQNDPKMSPKCPQNVPKIVLKMVPQNDPPKPLFGTCRDPSESSSNIELILAKKTYHQTCLKWIDV